MSGNKRIMKELADINNNPPQGCEIKLPREDDIYIWEVTMQAPSDSIYAGGRYMVQVTLPKEYPFKPPVIAFRTKIYHPNVSNDERGAMCLGMLRAEDWKPPNKIADVLKLVRTVLGQPQPDDSVEAAIADQYKTNRQAFEKTAKEWVVKYAK